TRDGADGPVLPGRRDDRATRRRVLADARNQLRAIPGGDRLARGALARARLAGAGGLRRTFWLASYPKSGNTWFRLLVANLRQDKPVDINDLPEHSGIASARGLFDNVMLFPSGLLTH